MAANLSGIVINEFMPDPTIGAGPAGYDTDGSGAATDNDEFVELLNTSGVNVDISGFQLWDAGQGNWFTFPSGTILASGGRAVVVTGVDAGGSLPTVGAGSFAFDAGLGSSILNNGGDNIVLLDPTSVPKTFIQAIYGSGEADDPPLDYSGFPADAMRVGAVDDFGNDSDGSSIQRTPDGSDTFINNETPTPGAQNVCFTSGTMIATPDGEREIDTLRVGDMVSVRDGEPQAIRWIHSKLLPKAYLKAQPKKYPIKIKANALADGVPNVDLSVSPQHRILLTGKIAMRMFDTDEILVGAIFLTELDGVSVDETVDSVTYFHVMLDQHQVMCANGAHAESLYLGKQARLALSPEALQEVCAVFPELNDADFNVSAARKIVSGKPARKLIQRHIKNAKPVFDISSHPTESGYASIG